MDFSSKKKRAVFLRHTLQNTGKTQHLKASELGQSVSKAAGPAVVVRWDGASQIQCAQRSPGGPDKMQILIQWVWGGA